MVMVWSAGLLTLPACTKNPSEELLTSICGVAGVPVTVIVKLAGAVVLPHASVAVKLKLKEPVVVGVPVIERDPSVFVWMTSPLGSAPPDTRKFGEGENGVTQPPEVVRNVGDDERRRTGGIYGDAEVLVLLRV